MPSVLSTADHYQDRLEIVGYGSTLAAGCVFLVYFTMLFFSSSVQAQSISSKLAILLFSLLFFIIGFFIPLYKNWARLWYRGLLLLITSFSFFELFDQGTWYFGLLFFYALYCYWVLSHPMSIQFFRPLSAREQPLTKRSGWYLAQLSMLNVLALVFFLKGWSGLMQTAHTNNVIQGLGYLLLASCFLLLLWGLRRLKPWARWLMIITAGLFFVATLPRTFTQPSQTYFAYWKSLAITGYYLFLATFLIWAPSMKRLYQRIKA